MLGDQPRDQGMILDRREENALLNFKMVGELELVAVDGLARELGDVRRRRILAQRAFGKYTQAEAVVVLLRKRNQAAIAKHRNLASLSIAGSSTDRSAA